MVLKKRILKLLSFLIIFCAVVGTATLGLADAGNFSGGSDYGGGSSGGSSWSSSSSSWSGGGGGGSADFGDCFGVVALIVFIILVINARNKKGKGGKGGKGGGTPSGGAPAGRATMDPKRLKEKDPNFSEQEFLEKVANAYVQMQNCWQDKKWEPMRPLMTDALYSQFDRQLDELRRNHRTNYVERIAVLGCRIVGYYQDKNNDNLMVEVRTRIVDYTVDDETGKVVSGSKTAEKFMTYEWTLIRSKDRVTPDKDAVHEIHCPNCGAPLSINHSVQCEYCGQVVTVNDYDWVISAIRGISQVTR